MAKLKTIFICSNCGTQSPKWMGKCSGCGEWNTLLEELQTKPQPADKFTKSEKTSPTLIQEVKTEDFNRLQLTDNELNRVLGGGLVPGALILVGGEPGIGKSTLLLQAALASKGNVLYVSGEESMQQIKMRADRVGIKNPKLYLYGETTIEDILQQVQELSPDYVIIDSIQTIRTMQVEGAPGSIVQIREATDVIRNFAKREGVSFFIIGHITKEGTIAGPKLLEHLVDTVLQFEGDRQYNYRLLRCLKNRFGSIDEIGVYEMDGTGLRAIENPSEILISHRESPVSGVAIAVFIEGQRAFAIEVQALVSRAVYGTPQRTSTSYNVKRLQLLLAVLDKKCGYGFSTMDVYLNIVGGFKIEDTSVDLAVVAALVSSYKDKPISSKICFSGEIGLTGEVRSVHKLPLRIAEAQKLGFDSLVISKYNKTKPTKNTVFISHLSELEQIIR